MDRLSLNGPGVVKNKSNLSRAEQFEYEKKRIIESCFSKREEDGSISESYITHLRVEEDAAHPSSPPPPNSSPDLKKSRTIIVAVRKTGRVRVHKARENANGTFSIGKTWILDDLSAVQSYTGATPPGPNGEQHKQWAGSTGFIVTLGKSYYWKANSQKEKQFFIASLIKIYHKYTGGEIPELIGFDQRERDQLSGVASSSSRSQSSSAQPGSSLNQPQNRTSRRGLATPVQSAADAGKTNPTSISGMSPIKKSKTRAQRSSQSGSVDLNMSSSSFIKNLTPTSKLTSSVSQQSLGQNEDVAYFSSRQNDLPTDTSNSPGKFQNFSKLTDSLQSLNLEASSTSPRGRRDSENSPQPRPTPLSLQTETRKPAMSGRHESRERISGLTKIPIPVPLYSPAIRPEESPRFQSVDKVRSYEPSISLEEPSSTNKNQVQVEESRVGLGPMLKAKAKADVGGILNGAANALNSLKPIVGGAADRLRDFKSRSYEDSDGSTGGFPGKGYLRPSSNTGSFIASTATDVKISQKKDESPVSQDIKFFQSNKPDENLISVLPSEILSEKSKAREDKRTKTPNEQINKELAMLGVDPLILGMHCSDIIAAWEQFGWYGEGMRTKNIDEMKDEVERELYRIQAGGWLSLLEEEDGRIEAIKKGIDKVIEECDEFDGLLTLYLVELGTLNDDVAYIEAQSQGLQVQTANQKLLKAELQSLLQTISISPEQIESLRESSLESTRGLHDIEKSLVILFKAMLTIDPSLGISSPRRSEDGSLVSGRAGAYGNSEIGSMRVLQEKKDVYKSEITLFLRRLKQFLQIKFAATFDVTRQALEREKGGSLSRTSAKVKLDPGKYDLARGTLWKYSPLMLFTREVDQLEWENLIKMYGQVLMLIYQEDFRDAVMISKRAARKPSGEESDALFTSQFEKQTEGLATTARKLTVIKSQNLAKSLLSPSTDSSKVSLDKIPGLEPFELFEEILSRMASVMSMEQNFLVDFFHVTSLGLHDFPETVMASIPEDRRGIDIRRPRVMDPNRGLAMLVVQSMEEIYSFFPKDFQGLIDWCIQSDPLQVVGLIAALEKKIPEYEETNQEYLNRLLQKLHTQLTGVFIKILDDQIHVIEETKVKTKKRKGVIGFIKTFPLFANALERKLIRSQNLEIRNTVNNAYTRVNKAMFEALKVIARENPLSQMAVSDQADKEALNYEILLMQNMHFYFEEVDTRSNPVLEEWKQNASDEMDEHMALYLKTVIRRPLGKLLDFIESVESMMLTRRPGEPVSRISSMPSHSKSSFKKVLSSYDVREIRRGIEVLRKRIEKHFGDDHDSSAANGSGLVRNVIQKCEKYYEDVEDRILIIIRDVYDGEIALEWTRADISASFRK
ncbi:Exocyst complex component SEC3 [Golovinomyces cichoracearum]|uniref:Exocyst complex component SEC3 n=1 Tax=Golovinomyces cichoracearum TaxID=62708 RepID=A0A420HQX9_9PEZI|nr:Exocyst complex component SEC3 [Golovinomyces cichoracearum]